MCLNFVSSWSPLYYKRKFPYTQKSFDLDVDHSGIVNFLPVFINIPVIPLFAFEVVVGITNYQRIREILLPGNISNRTLTITIGDSKVCAESASIHSIIMIIQQIINHILISFLGLKIEKDILGEQCWLNCSQYVIVKRFEPAIKVTLEPFVNLQIIFCNFFRVLRTVDLFSLLVESFPQKSIG